MNNVAKVLEDYARYVRYEEKPRWFTDWLLETLVAERELLLESYANADAWERLAQVYYGYLQKEKWVSCSEYFPQKEDADQEGLLWLYDEQGVFLDHYENAELAKYWMRKPRAIKPNPPQKVT